MENSQPTLQKKLKDFIKDPGILFNTGYLATFASLVPSVGSIPLKIMIANWVAGGAILAHRKGLLPQSISSFFEQAPKAANPDSGAPAPRKSRMPEFMKRAYGGIKNLSVNLGKRKFGALAVNGVCLMTAGLAVIGLDIGHLAPHLTETLAQPVLKTIATLFTSPVTFASVLSLGYGASNLKKADEMDGKKTWLFEKLPFLKKIKSEYTVALAGISLCLMASGWSWLAVPPLVYATGMALPSATGPKSKMYRMTKWLATSKFSPLPRRIKNNLYRQHPLTISRSLDFATLGYSVVPALVTFAVKSAIAGAPVFSPSELAALGNISHTGGAYRLYQLTEQQVGDMPKTSLPEETAADMTNGNVRIPAPTPSPSPVPPSGTLKPVSGRSFPPPSVSSAKETSENTPIPVPRDPKP